MDVEELIRRFDLQPHPEGGFFKESYRANGILETKQGTRNHSTAIYFLLPQGKKSAFHRLSSDEMWHFYLGGPLDLFEISPEGRLSQTTLGQDLNAGHKLQYTVPAGTWFGAMPSPGSLYSFVGCTVAPGFDFADFVMARRASLLDLCPKGKPIIDQLVDL